MFLASFLVGGRVNRWKFSWFSLSFLHFNKPPGAVAILCSLDCFKNCFSHWFTVYRAVPGACRAFEA